MQQTHASICGGKRGCKELYTQFSILDTLLQQLQFKQLSKSKRRKITKYNHVRETSCVISASPLRPGSGQGKALTFFGRFFWPSWGSKCLQNSSAACTGFLESQENSDPPCWSGRESPCQTPNELVGSNRCSQKLITPAGNFSRTCLENLVT